jgi:hypothetical protein
MGTRSSKSRVSGATLMPRQRALDAVKQREVCALISVGCGVEMAARYVGCSARTIRREALRDAVFYEELRQAELRANLTPLDALGKAAQRHWRAAAWFLERTQPTRFGRRNQGKYTERQFAAATNRLHKIVLEEVTDRAVLERIAHRFEDLEYEELVETWAAHASRPDVHRRIRRMSEQRRAMVAPPPRSAPDPQLDDPDEDSQLES